MPRLGAVRAGARGDDWEAVVSYYSGRVTVITGAGSGIGRSLAIELARQGTDLALADRDGDAVTDTARQCSGARVRADVVDVSDRQAMIGYSAAVLGEFGRVDLVFCAAGVIHTGSLLASEFADLSRVIDINLSGIIHTAKTFLPALISSGRGHLVTFSSGLGLMAASHHSAYSASKFAVRGFSEALRQEMVLDGHPVAVTCVFPGRIRTPIMRSGSFAAGENAARIAARFEKLARLDADQAAAIIMRDVPRRRARLLVGRDGRSVSALIRLAGSSYQDLLPVLAQRRRKRRRLLRRGRG
jgi:NADP-dependent 3-hydroxy acid dehydrogenase YdfG